MVSRSDWYNRPQTGRLSLTSGPFVPGAKGPSVPKICLRRDLFTTGPGPDSGGSKPGRYGWPHMPEKSGMDAAVCTLAGPAASTPICPQAGVTTAAAITTNERKSRCLCMPHLPGAVVRKQRGDAHASGAAPDQWLLRGNSLPIATLATPARPSLAVLGHSYTECRCARKGAGGGFCEGFRMTALWRDFQLQGGRRPKASREGTRGKLRTVCAASAMGI
jgi:hypothetical protein